MAGIKDSPRVYVPPPFVYVGFFLLSLLLQRMMPIDKSFLSTPAARVIAVVLIIAGLIIDVLAIRQFIRTKNTFATMKPATSLQTTGIYAISRNPMYLSLLLLYTAIALLVGNWWTMMLIPVLVAVVTVFIIRLEERYLERAFGNDYLEYKQRVRRWI